MKIRRYLSWLVVLWLVCQGTASAAAPFALCLEHSHSTGAAGDPSCPLHQHGTGGDPGGTALRCQCHLDSAALSALIIGTGLLPGSVSVSDSDSFEFLVSFDSSASSHIHLPDRQPPR